MNLPESKDPALRALNRKINELFGDILQRSTGRTVRYQYYTDGTVHRPADEFHYTTEKVRAPNGRMKYAAGIYRYYLHSKKYGSHVWVLRKSVYFAKKWRADEWAYRKYCESIGQKYSPSTAAGRRAAAKKEASE